MNPGKEPVEKAAPPAKPSAEPKGASATLRKAACAGALVVLVFCASFYSVENNNQLGMMGGWAEEYLALGVNMYYSGSFYLSDTIKTPFAFRPPGYVKYLDLVMKSGGLMKPAGYTLHSPEEFEQVKAKMLHGIYISQCLLITAASLVLFFLLGELLDVVLAFIIAGMFGINPYLVMLAGFVHYETLHIFLLVLSTWLLYLGFARKRTGPIFLFLSGISWGLTTLVRPVSLILPALLAVMVVFYYGRRWKSALLCFCIVTLSFIGTLAPYSYRNYRLLHRFIPVNAQSGVSFWASSQKSLPLDANHYRWWRIWFPDGQEIYEKITGARKFDTALYAGHVLEFEDYFWSKFKKNLASQPLVYVKNACGNFLLLNFGMNSVLIQMFQYQQLDHGEISKTWMEEGNPQDFYPAHAANAFTFLMLIMTLFSLAGIFLALWQNDKRIYVPLLAFLTIVIAHSITYMDLMYYYVRIPFLFIFTAFFVCHLKLLTRKSNAVAVQRAIVFTLAAFIFALYAAVIA
jgi:hypothetical protein